MKIVANARFIHELAKLARREPKYRAKIQKTIDLFSKNPSHPSLRLHTIHGTGNYSISVDMKIRIILHRDDDSTLLIRIGTHDEVYSK